MIGERRDESAAEAVVSVARYAGGSLRHVVSGDDVGPRFLALDGAARFGRILAMLVVALVSLVAGWGSRPLLAAILLASLVSAVLLPRLIVRISPYPDRAAVDAGCWTVALLAFAVASLTPGDGAYYHGPVALVALAVATSFAGTLRPRVALSWLLVSSCALLIAEASASGLDADAVLTPLAMIVVGAIGIGGNMARRDAELDRRDLAELARRLDPSANVVTIAAEVAEAIARWGMFHSVAIVAFEGKRSATVLAKTVVDADVLPHEPGEPLPAPRAAYVRERAEHGPWIERERTELVVHAGRPVRLSGRALAYTPIVGDEGPAGVIVVAARAATPEQGLALLADELPVLVDAASLAAAVFVPALAHQEAEVERRESLSRTIAAKLFHPVFQPVLDLATGHVVGFEALTRFDDGTAPDRVFAQADRLGLSLALEEVTMAEAVAQSRDLPADAWLSLNLSPAFLLSKRAAPILRGETRSIVLELTEHVAIDDYGQIHAALTGLGPNVRLAVDDAGAGFASLRHVIELEPDIVKLDLALIRGIDADASRQALLSSLCHFAAKTNCRLLAEGIETDGELDMIRSLGIGLGQGYLLGRPARLEIAPAERPPVSRRDAA